MPKRVQPQISPKNTPYIIKWKVMRSDKIINKAENTLIFNQILSTYFIKDMYLDCSGEFSCGYYHGHFFNMYFYAITKIEDITWPRGDTKFLFEWAQRMSEISFQHEKRNFVSPSGHVMFYLLYKHQWNTKPFHFHSFLVWKSWFIM